MKKIILSVLIAAMVLSLFACADKNKENDPENQDTKIAAVSPLPMMDVSNEAVEDFTIPASFTVGDIDLEADAMTFEAFGEEIYDTVEISSLAEGDTITIEGKEITVRTKEESEYGIEINGGTGNAEDGYTLVSNGGGTYVVQLFDDYHTYESLGILSLPLSEDLVLIDAIEDPAGIVVEKANIGEYLQSLPEYATTFSYGSTAVTVEGGKVVEINRRWVP